MNRVCTCAGVASGAADRCRTRSDGNCGCRGFDSPGPETDDPVSLAPGFDNRCAARAYNSYITIRPKPIVISHFHPPALPYLCAFLCHAATRRLRRVFPPRTTTLIFQYCMLITHHRACVISQVPGPGRHPATSRAARQPLPPGQSDRPTTSTTRQTARRGTTARGQMRSCCGSRHAAIHCILLYY